MKWAGARVKIMHKTGEAKSARDGRGSGTMSLWACALVLAGLLAVQLGRVPVRSQNAALANMSSMAEMVTKVGDYSMLTFSTGTEEFVAVMDGRTEELFFYRVKPIQGLELLSRESIPGLFNQAQQRRGVRP